MKSIKYVLTIMLVMFISISTVKAEPLLAKMESVNGAIAITFSDFADAQGFENYTCNVDLGSWTYSLPASKIVVNNNELYRCLDQGGLSSGVKYKVNFTFEDRPYGYSSNSPDFTLIAN